MRTSRRTLLASVGGVVAAVAAGGALVETDVLPGRAAMHRALGWTGPSGTIPDVTPGRVRRGSLDGSAYVVCEPPGGGAGLPVVLAFHGASFDAEDLVSRFGVGRFLAASGQRFVIAGTDDVTLTLDRLAPRLAELGYAVDRPALLGWSAGAYTALGVALDDPTDLTALALTSPALLGGAQDPVLDRVASLRGLPLRVDCGHEDPFYDAVTTFRDRLDAAGVDVTVSIEPGEHNVAYWTRVLPNQLTWLGVQL